MKLCLISFSELPVYASSILIQGKHLKERIELYVIGSKKFKKEYNSEFDEKHLLLVDTPERPSPSKTSLSKYNKAKKSIFNFIKDNNIDDIYFINKHIWNLFLCIHFKNKVKLYHCLHDPLGHNGDKISKSVYYYNKVLIKFLDGIVTLSDKSFHETKNVLKPKCKITKLPLIQCERNSYEPIRNTKNILFFGRLNNYKGVEFLPLIADELKILDKDITITIAGKRSNDVDDSVFEEIKKRDNINFLDRFIDESEVDDLYYNADLVLMPYKSITQSGIIVDSYNHSRPIICFGIEGINEFINNSSAIISKPFDVKEISKQIFEYINMSDENKARMAKASFELGKDLFSPEVFVDKFLNFVE